ncbi:MAG TPA: hypothetical protein VLL54_09965 [Pyrinomonadaceae bacterium]|nr:hypothetical protein [Pyrinomonadaceae bacterium]
MSPDNLTYLQSTPLFQGITEAALKGFIKNCSITELDVGERLHINRRNLAEVPISIVFEGCLAIHANTAYGKHKIIVLALVMPFQLVGEYQYFGDELPDRLEVIAIHKTRVLSFSPNSLRELIKGFPVVNHNLAKTILLKQHISNFRLEAVCQTKGDHKIATLLTGFIRIPEWLPTSYADLHFKQEMSLPIMWSVELMTRFLSCNVRTVRDGLWTLVEAKLITIQWFDHELRPLNDVDAEHLQDLGKRHGRVDDKTYFRISIPAPNKLEEYCGE